MDKEIFEPLNSWWENEDPLKMSRCPRLVLKDGELVPQEFLEESDHDEWDVRKVDNPIWRSSEPCGIQFPKPYEYQEIPFYYQGQLVELPLELEEVGYHWALATCLKYHEKPRFKANFWQAFQEIALIYELRLRSFEECDFSGFHEFVQRQKEEKNDISEADRKRRRIESKEQAMQNKIAFGRVLVNGFIEELAGFQIEPNSLFRGRGDHPRMGFPKGVCSPNHVSWNISRDACPPTCQIPGEAWRDIVHRDHVSWVACYPSLTGSKYIRLNDKTAGKADWVKYEKARQLHHHIDKIREGYIQDMAGNDEVGRQHALATYLIDECAFRVGGEKDLEKEADTVGCASLRKSHVTPLGQDRVRFDFPGKDSIRYHNTIKLIPVAYQTLTYLIRGPGDQVFPDIQPSTLNKYLSKFMHRLSAKVFRTYNASATLARELSMYEPQLKEDLPEHLDFYKSANHVVSVLCNHQKTLSSSAQEAQEAKQADLKTAFRDQHKEILRELKELAKTQKKEKDPKVAKKIESLKVKEVALNRKLNSAVQWDTTIALDTAKRNYMDPRITVSFCKKHQIPINKIYSTALMDKFAWCMSTPTNYDFFDMDT